jgi:hypothetical protein
MNTELLEYPVNLTASKVCALAMLVARDGNIIHCSDDAGGTPLTESVETKNPSWRTIYDVFDGDCIGSVVALLDATQPHVEMQLTRLQDGRDMAVTLRAVDDHYFFLQCFSARHWRGVMDSEAESRNLVYSMLANCNEQGTLLTFFREAVRCADILQFLELFFRTLSGFGLVAIISVHHRNYAVMLQADGSLPSSCEQRLLDACRDCGSKIFCAGPRGLFRGQNISFVIKNMPAESEHAGRLRDHLAILLDGADVIVDQVLLDVAEATRKETALLGALSNNERMLQALDKEFERQNQAIMGAINTIISKMYSEFCYLHLTDQEEDQLISIINEGIAPLTEVITSKVTLRRAIRASIDQLKRAIDGSQDVMPESHSAG